MDNLLDLIKSRRSVRNFEDKDVPENLMQTILESVQWSQSWANTQCWEIVVVKDPAIREKLQGAVPKANPAHKSVVDAPVVLALCAKKESSGYYKGLVTTKFGDWFMFDIGLAAQHISLTAHSLGLGTVIIGLFDHDQAKVVLNIPVEYELVALMPLGFPSKIPSPPKRRLINEFVHVNTF
ncbi:MAG: nitroreductase family protein [Desulfobacterales bacterium]|jgi:nitroreductase|nr:nitroreductase family protein [Desulfobacterales bacterium]